jgi:dipeptidyl aminopeptidase/acylaminoacyl peptidase
VRTLGFSAGLFLGCFFLQAGPTLDRALDSLSSVHQFHEAALSPDGATVAWTETIPGRDAKARESFVYVKDLRDPASSPRRIAETSESDQSLAWSRDGRLAFLSRGDSCGQLQVYVAEKPGHGKPRRVTDLKGYISDPH